MTAEDYRPPPESTPPGSAPPRSAPPGRSADSGHIDNGVLAAYLDRRLAEEDRERIEAHLADCEECAEQIAIATRSLTGLRRRRWPVVAVPGLIAAGIAAVLVLGPVAGGSGVEEGPVLRDGPGRLGQVGEEPIRVVAPGNGVLLPRDSLQFAWSPVAEDAFYSFTITDAVGDVVWEGTTKETRVGLGSRVLLREGERYFWYVDALFGEGRSASTGVREFTAGR